MAVKINGIEKRSLLKKYNLNYENAELISINQNEINDVLDYRFYSCDTNLDLIIKTDGVLQNITVKKQEYTDLGLIFDTYLIDNQWHCKNKCIFCFIDQMPKNMRDTLYFKDDDARLSFLFGNYITLTNLSQTDIDRIIKMKTSPINVSVHSTEKQTRIKMMGNSSAGNCMEILKQLSSANIKLNAQLVICPGINDGENLFNSMKDLSELIPNLQSVSVVPVGITKYRDNLFKLLPMTKQPACDIIKLVSNFGELMLQQFGSRIFYLADEFFVKAEMDLPSTDYYEEYLQLENGVGVRALFAEQFLEAKAYESKKPLNKKIGIITAVASYEFILGLVDNLKTTYPNLAATVYYVKNDFFGETIDVAGLITGRDIINQLKEIFVEDICLIPEVMVNHTQEKFLDDITVQKVSKALDTKVKIVKIDGEAFFTALFEE